MQFRLVEVASPRRGEEGHLVSVLKLPQWKPFNADIVPVGNTRIILTQNLESAITLIRMDSSSPRNGSSTSTRRMRTDTVTYLVLSVTHIVLCRIVDGILRYTKPEPFLNGTDPLSDAAICLLIFATLPTYPHTLLHRLPEELQNMILDRISLGSIEGARVGCMLGLGSPFSWRSEGKQLKREQGHRNRTRYTPVEQQIWFEDHHSGVVYKCD